MTSESARKQSGWWAFIRTVLLIVGVLILAQGIRMLLFWLGWRLAQPGPDGWAWEALSIFSFLLTGTILWLVLRPAGRDLGLEWGAMRRIGRISVLAGEALLLALLISSALLDSSLLLANLHSVLVVPLFEEAIFRGWGWSRLERSLSGRLARLAGFLTYLVMTGLFALWHLGYGDVVYLRGLGSQTADPPLRVILFYKVLTGGAVGMLAGFARWRTGKLYWPFLLHGFWNMFGR